MKNVLVSGISRGLGFELSRRLLENGYQVYGISRSSSEDLEALQGAYVDQLHWRACDLSEPEGLKEQLFTDFLSLQTPIHAFVNNAAIVYDDIITNMKLAPLEELFAVNVFSPMLLCREVIRNMLFHKQAGSLVHLSSISAHTGYKGLSMYAATKGALEAFSRTTAREWGTKAIRSNCVVAGFMETAMTASLNSEQKAKIYRRNALKEPVNIDSVVQTILFLLQAASQSITGQNIIVDSGSL